MPIYYFNFNGVCYSLDTVGEDVIVPPGSEIVTSLPPLLVDCNECCNPVNITPTPEGCIFLGVSGAFVATADGILTFYFNDEIWNNNSGEVEITLSPGTKYTVAASAEAGVAGPLIAAGVVYTYRANGTWRHDSSDSLTETDADGAFVTGGGNAGDADVSYICPGLTRYSLVAKFEPL